MAEAIKTIKRYDFQLSKKEVMQTIGDYIKANNIKTPFKNIIPRIIIFKL